MECIILKFVPEPGNAWYSSILVHHHIIYACKKDAKKYVNSQQFAEIGQKGQK